VLAGDVESRAMVNGGPIPAGSPDGMTNTLRASWDTVHPVPAHVFCGTGYLADPALIEKTYQQIRVAESPCLGNDSPSVQQTTAKLPPGNSGYQVAEHFDIRCVQCVAQPLCGIAAGDD